MNQVQNIFTTRLEPSYQLAAFDSRREQSVVSCGLNAQQGATLSDYNCGKAAGPSQMTIKTSGEAENGGQSMEDEEFVKLIGSMKSPRRSIECWPRV